MPPGSQFAELPRPLDDDVILREEAARRVAVLRFSGLGTRDNLDRHAGALRARIEARGETAAGDVSYAFYDPPWTLPSARRNEVMIALQR